MADRTTEDASQLSDISIKAGTLGQIKEKETALRERLIKARREAGEIIAGAKEESRKLREKMAADARAKAQEQLEKEILKARSQAETTIKSSTAEMEDIKKNGEQNVPPAVGHVMGLVIPTYKNDR